MLAAVLVLAPVTSSFRIDDPLRQEDARVFEAGLLGYLKPDVPLTPSRKIKLPGRFSVFDRAIYVMDHTGSVLEPYPDEKIDDDKRLIPTDPTLRDSFLDRNRESELMSWFRPTSKWIKVVKAEKLSSLRRTYPKPVVYSVCRPGYSKDRRWAFLNLGYTGFLHPGRIQLWLKKTKSGWVVARKVSTTFL